MAATTVDVLLIEDNQGDVRLVEEMLRDAQPLLHRINLDGATPETIDFQHEPTLAEGIAYLDGESVDVILLDLGLPDSDSLETLLTVVEETEFVPIVVLTGLDDRELGIQAIQHGAQDYLVKDEVTGELLVHAIDYAIERVTQEVERVQYRKQLENLNHLNTITQEITHDLITTSSRTDLERAVCEQLVTADAFRFACIGDIDPTTGEFAARQCAGVEPTRSDPARADEGDEERPETRAVRTRELQVGTPYSEGSGDDTDDSDIGGVVAVPITYRSVFYGVLAIYAVSADTVTAHETAILSRLGEVIGHAITSIERKEALVSDTALQLEFTATGVATDLVFLSQKSDCTIEFDTFIRSDDGLLVYGTVTGIRESLFREVAGGTQGINDLRILSHDSDCFEFEFVTASADHLDDAVATHGGRIAEATIESGECRFTVEFPQGREKRTLVELVEGTCDSASLRAHRTVEQDDPSIPETRSIFTNRLTPKQRVALQTAFHAGYFEWPRPTNGEEIAARLGISQATFSQHFRGAQRELFTVLFEGEDATDETAPSPWN